MSVALVAGTGEVLYEFRSGETRDQGNLILNHAEAALKKYNLRYQDLTLLAAATGPGSFTGIRIGIAAVRGLALASGVPCLGIDSFNLFHAAQPGKKTLVVLESWRAEFYARLDGETPINVTAEEIQRRYAGEKALCIAGDAAEKMRPFFPAAEYPAFSPAAAHLAALAFRQYLENPGAVQKPAPFYLRDADVTLPAAKKA